MGRVLLLICNVPFQIGDGCLQLASSQEYMVQMPKELGPIRVGLKCKSLHMLHATGYTAKVGSQVGEYRIAYEDGTAEAFPILYGVNTSDWWWPQLLPKAAVAWRGENEVSRQSPDRGLQLYATSWRNPHPEKRIETIVMRTAAKELAAPFCLAITADRESEGLDYQQLALQEDTKLFDGVWERRRGEDETVNWITQVLAFHQGKSELTAFDADGDIIWKNECEYVPKRCGNVRVLELANFHALEGSNKGLIWPGPQTLVYTTRGDRLVTIDGAATTDRSRPRVNFWSPKPTPE